MQRMAEVMEESSIPSTLGGLVQATKSPSLMFATLLHAPHLMEEIDIRPESEASVRLMARVNEIDLSGTTPLMYTSMLGRVDVARYLLKKGASVDMRDDDNMTALLYACAQDRVDCVRLLLEHGADVDDLVRVPDVSVGYKCFRLFMTRYRWNMVRKTARAIPYLFFWIDTHARSRFSPKSEYAVCSSYVMEGNEEGARLVHMEVVVREMERALLRVGGTLDDVRLAHEIACHRTGYVDEKRGRSDSDSDSS